MITKLLTFGIIIIGAFAAFRAFGRAASEQITRGEQSARDTVQQRQNGEEMIRCSKCGSWVHPQENCSCASPAQEQAGQDTGETK